jgi:hypothetical protein
MIDEPGRCCCGQLPPAGHARHDERAGKLSATRDDRFLKLHLIGEGTTSHYCMMREKFDGKTSACEVFRCSRISRWLRFPRYVKDPPLGLAHEFFPPVSLTAQGARNSAEHVIYLRITWPLPAFIASRCPAGPGDEWKMICRGNCSSSARDMWL